MARMTNKNSVAVLDEADRAERILNWQLFCIEQEQLLWGGPKNVNGSNWRPGKPLSNWQYTHAVVGGNFPEDYDVWGGPRGNWHRRSFDLFHPVYPDMDCYQGVEDEDGNPLPITYAEEQQLYKRRLRTIVANTIAMHKVAVCMDCEVGWDNSEEQQCFSCGKEFPYKEPEPKLSIKFQDNFTMSNLRPRQPSFLENFGEPMQMPIPVGPPLHVESDEVLASSQEYRTEIVDFAAEYDIDFHIYRFHAMGGGQEAKYHISANIIMDIDNLEEVLTEIKAGLLRNVRHLLRGEPEEDIQPTVRMRRQEPYRTSTEPTEPEPVIERSFDGEHHLIQVVMGRSHASFRVREEDVADTNIDRDEYFTEIVNETVRRCRREWRSHNLDPIQSYSDILERNRETLRRASEQIEMRGLRADMVVLDEAYALTPNEVRTMLGFDPISEGADDFTRAVISMPRQSGHGSLMQALLGRMEDVETTGYPWHMTPSDSVETYVMPDMGIFERPPSSGELMHSLLCEYAEPFVAEMDHPWLPPVEPGLVGLREAGIPFSMDYAATYPPESAQKWVENWAPILKKPGNVGGLRETSENGEGGMQVSEVVNRRRRRYGR